MVRTFRWAAAAALLLLQVSPYTLAQTIVVDGKTVG